MELVGVKINCKGKVYYFSSDKLKLKKNITVVVKNEKGIYFGKVVSVNKIEKNNNYNKILRVSNKRDYNIFLQNIKLSKIVLQKSKKLIEELEIQMNIIDCIFSLDKSQLIIKYTAEGRVDFRILAKELGAMFRTRIEFRQIGIRDKAKEIGGIGPCGRKLCCCTYLEEFEIITISMAKNQLVALNPNKINGLCGRLFCCLNYEDENYNYYKRNYPEIGDIIKCSYGECKVISLDIFHKKYRVLTKENEVQEVYLEDGSKK